MIETKKQGHSVQLSQIAAPLFTGQLHPCPKTTFTQAACAGGGAAEKRDEPGARHSITSSALILACLCESDAKAPTTLLAITANKIVKPNSATCTGSSTYKLNLGGNRK